MARGEDDSGGWWRQARRDARLLRARLLLGAAQTKDTARDTDALLEQAVSHASLVVRARPDGDTLLCGAHAVLDPEAETIWVRASAAQAERRLFVAHELAHFFLHGGQNNDLWQAGCFGDVAGEADDMLVSVGYGPAQRREAEANVWAREFLLPAPLAKEWFTNGDDAIQIRNRAGLTLPVVFAQLLASLTDPVFVREPEPVVLPDAAPPPLTLDPTQDFAARILVGPTLTHAGPGTGKTRTLAARVLFLTHEERVRPENILVMTYGRKAAGELRERIALYAPDTARRIFISTFHAYGYDLLRRFWEEADLPPRPFLIETADAYAFLERKLADCDLQVLRYLHDPAYPLRDLLKTIGQAKEEGLTPDDLADLARETGEPKHEEAARVFAVYQAVLSRHGALDYPDLMHRPVRLLRENPSVRRAEQAHWKHVLVDEYQDVNRVGAELLQLLTGDGAGLWAVGDVRQAIYQFRGASPANVSRFDTDFPGGFRTDLGVNYRSAPQLVHLLGSACGDGETWQSARDADGSASALPTLAPAVYAVAGDERAQWDGIAQKMRDLVETGSRWDDMAVLCRTNNQAKDAANALTTRGIVCAAMESSAPGGLLADADVKKLLALLSRACEPESVAKNQFPEITDAYLETLSDDPFLFLAGVLWGDLGWAKNLTNPAAVSGLLGIARSFRDRAALVMGSDNNPAKEETETQDESPDTRPAFLAHLRRMALVGSSSLFAYTAVPPDESGRDAGVRVTTVHSAKGLEFPVVFVPNLSAGKFPSRPGSGLIPPVAASDGENETVNAEETRLFFVALSRAQNALFLTRAEKYNNRRAQPSPLLVCIESAQNAGLLRGEIWPAAAQTAAAQTAAAQTAAEAAEPQAAFAAEPEPALEPTADAPPFIEAWEAELYLRCPRKYYFERIQGVATHAELSAYQVFKRSLSAALSAPDALRANAVLEASRDNLAASENEKTYRNAAETILSRHFAGAGGTPTEPFATLTAFVIERPQGSLVVRAENADNNGLILRVFRKTPRTNTAEADFKAALLMEINPSVSVRFLQTGDVLPVKATDAARQKIVAHADRALVGIALRVFAPDPAEPDECLNCPHLFICS